MRGDHGERFGLGDGLGRFGLKVEQIGLVRGGRGRVAVGAGFAHRQGHEAICIESRALARTQPEVE